jgi:hypothetical protein
MNIDLPLIVSGKKILISKNNPQIMRTNKRLKSNLGEDSLGIFLIGSYRVKRFNTSLKTAIYQTE